MSLIEPLTTLLREQIPEHLEEESEESLATIAADLSLAEERLQHLLDKIWLIRTKRIHAQMGARPTYTYHKVR